MKNYSSNKLILKLNLTNYSKKLNIKSLKINNYKQVIIN